MLRFLSGILILFSLTCCNSDLSRQKEPGKGGKQTTLPFDPHGQLILTRHARCRMDCRHITEREIHEILDEGEVNYDKSEPSGKPDPKWAVEGYTTEQQHLRIVIAPEGEKLIVVTCIELGVEWECHCN